MSVCLFVKTEQTDRRDICLSSKTENWGSDMTSLSLNFFYKKIRLGLYMNIIIMYSIKTKNIFSDICGFYMGYANVLL